MEEHVSMVNKGDDPINLPAGFRFHPTDEEIIIYYLVEKVKDSNFTCYAIGEADFNRCEPWDLPRKAKMGENEWYLFCLRDRKYPTGMRTNRATEKGYWKATGKDKEICSGRGCLIGMKKTLVFYVGRAPKGQKTNWVMHELRLEGKFAYKKGSKDEWVVCKVFCKNTGIKKSPSSGTLGVESMVNDMLNPSQLPPLVDPPYSENEFKAILQESNFQENPMGNSSYSHVPIPNPLFPFPGARHPNPEGINNRDMMSQKDPMQMSASRSMVTCSQDTALSSDINPEISSYVSNTFQDLDGSSFDPVADVGHFWDY